MPQEIDSISSRVLEYRLLHNVSRYENVFWAHFARNMGAREGRRPEGGIVNMRLEQLRDFLADGGFLLWWGIVYPAAAGLVIVFAVFWLLPRLV